MMRSKLLLGEWLNLAFWVHFATRLLTTVMRRSTYMHMFVFFFFVFFWLLCPLTLLTVKPRCMPYFLLASQASTKFTLLLHALLS